MRPLYDVCLSFAGEQRDYVRRVSRSLQQQHKLKVFLDEEQQVQLAATFLNESLHQIFRFQSKWCVLFASKEYVSKMWTIHERRSILERALKEPDGYVILGKFDDVSIPGLQDTYHYCDLNRYTPRQFAKLIADKIYQKRKIDREFIFFKMAMKQYPEARSLILKETSGIGNIEKQDRISLESYGFLCYNLACVETQLAKTATAPQDIEEKLCAALQALNLWVETPAMHPSLSFKEACKYVNDDDDLQFLRATAAEKVGPTLQAQLEKFRSTLARASQTISVAYTGSNGGCVSSDASIATPNGKKCLSDVLENDWVISVDIDRGKDQIATRATKLIRALEFACIRINEELICSRSQRLYCESKGWVAASELQPGLRLLYEDGSYHQVYDVVGILGPYEVMGFTTKHCSHNFFANGYLCHNVK